MKKVLMKKWITPVLAVFFFLVVNSVVWAQYPTKPINLIVGYPAGGITDVAARAFSEPMSKILQQPVVVLNKPGASEAVALTFLKGEKPDGYTIGCIAAGILGMYTQKVTFDVRKDFTPISGLFENFSGVVVPMNSPWKTFKELVNYAKNNPGKIKYATTGVATQHHLVMARLATKEGINWVHVPLKGGHAVITALLGGHIEVASSSPDWVPHVKAGRLRLLATPCERRLPSFPEVPTWFDLGYDISLKIVTSIVGPKGLPAPIVDRLNRAFKESMNDPNLIKTLNNYEELTWYRTPEEVAKFFNEMCNHWETFIPKMGLEIE